MSKKKKKSKKRSGLIVFLVIVGLILALAMSAAAFVDHYMDKINRTPEVIEDIVPPEEEDFETNVKTPEQSEIKPEEIEWPEDAVEVGDDHLLNILLVGQDRLEGQGRQRSDSMILCSINAKTKEVSMVSFLRDLYVQIPGGYADNRLNVTYAFGGFPLLDSTLNHNFGVTVDANVEVDFSQFVSVINAVGGVDINLSAAEAEIVFQTYAAGVYHLDGEKALTYSRIRIIDSDFMRTGRQRNVLTAVFEKAKQMSLSELLNFLEAILPSLTTDMTNTEIISTATKLFPILKDMKLESYRVPSDNEYYNGYVNGMSVLVPDLNLIRNRLKSEYLPLGG